MNQLDRVNKLIEYAETSDNLWLRDELKQLKKEICTTIKEGLTAHRLSEK